MLLQSVELRNKSLLTMKMHPQQLQEGQSLTNNLQRQYGLHPRQPLCCLGILWPHPHQQITSLPDKVLVPGLLSLVAPVKM